MDTPKRQLQIGAVFWHIERVLFCLIPNDLVSMLNGVHSKWEWQSGMVHWVWVLSEGVVRQVILSASLSQEYLSLRWLLSILVLCY